MTPAQLTPDLVLRGYRSGIFPMADPDEADAVYWYAPDPRGILPLDQFHVSKNLRKLIRQQKFEVTTDRAFAAVVNACAKPRASDAKTWISDEVMAVYEALYRYGFAHSVECWHEGELAGGLYGVHLGAAFFGESMFSQAADASKVALYHLVERMRSRGFRLLDVQFKTAHLAQFGVIEVARSEYERLLAEALAVDASWE